MQIKVTTSYSHLLYIQTRGVDFTRAIRQFSITKSPDFHGEGFNGYVEVSAEFIIGDLQVFSKLWNEWYNLPDNQRTFFDKLSKSEYKL